MTQLIALLGGGDWADASVEHIVLPDGLDLEEARRRYNAWYKDEYCPRLRTDTRIPYMSWGKWLIDREGARAATDAEVLEVWY